MVEKRIVEASNGSYFNINDEMCVSEDLVYADRYYYFVLDDTMKEQTLDLGGEKEVFKVTFKISGKKHYAYTDTNGYASLKISLTKGWLTDLPHERKSGRNLPCLQVYWNSMVPFRSWLVVRVNVLPEAYICTSMASFWRL